MRLVLKDLRWQWGGGTNVGGGLWARELGPYSCTQPFLRPGITGLKTELESFN